MSLDAAFVTALRRVTRKRRTQWELELRGRGRTLGRARAMQRELAVALDVLVRIATRLEALGGAPGGGIAAEARR